MKEGSILLSADCYYPCLIKLVREIEGEEHIQGCGREQTTKIRQRQLMRSIV